MSRPQRLRKLLWFDRRVKTLYRLADRHLAGVDEVGRGPLAGPVVAAACILHSIPTGVSIDDSKRLSPSARETAFPRILSCATVGVGFSSPEAIDRLGIQEACAHAMRQAVLRLSLPPSLVLLDGSWAPSNFPAEVLPIVGGDALSLRIACASIIAKVLRDRWMRRVHALVPEYGFVSHKGYGTKKHLKVLKAIGPSLFHRFSFRPVYQPNSE